MPPPRHEPCRYDAWYLPKDYKEYARREYRNYGESHVRGPSIDRYSAINVHNDATFEVRIFAGSVDPTEIQAALGLVHGTIEYTRSLNARSVIKEKGWDWEAFTAWTEKQNRYAALNHEIERLVRN